MKTVDKLTMGAAAAFFALTVYLIAKYVLDERKAKAVKAGAEAS